MKVSDVTGTPQSYVMQIGAENGSQNATLYGYSPGKVELCGNTSTGTDPRSSSGMQISAGLLNTWAQIASTSNGTTLAGYINGVPTISNTISFGLTATGGLSVGGSRNTVASAANHFLGSLDDFVIYDSALNASQVMALNGSAVSAIPEPSTDAAIAGALGLGCAVWRRRSAPK